MSVFVGNFMDVCAPHACMQQDESTECSWKTCNTTCLAPLHCFWLHPLFCYYIAHHPQAISIDDLYNAFPLYYSTTEITP